MNWKTTRYGAWPSCSASTGATASPCGSRLPGPRSIVVPAAPRKNDPMPVMQPSSRPKILVVLHQETSSAGRVGHLLLENGFDLDIRRPPLGDDLPETLEGHAGAVVFGGPMSANDT